MNFNIYGDESLPKILLLHPMGLTGANLYQILSPHLDGEYCCIAPDQGAHGDSGSYLSAEDEYKQLTGFLVQNGLKEFKAVYAESMGCALAVELIADQRFTIEHIWLDGGCLCEGSWILYFIMKTVFLRKARRMRRNPDLPPTKFNDAYGSAIGRRMHRNYLKYTDEDIRRISYACTHYPMKHVPFGLQCRMHIEWGEKDGNSWLSKRGLKRFYPEAEVLIREGEGHCTFMARHTDAYMKEFQAFLRG